MRAWETEDVGKKRGIPELRRMDGVERDMGQANVKSRKWEKLGYVYLQTFIQSGWYRELVVSYVHRCKGYPYDLPMLARMWLCHRLNRHWPSF